MSVSFFMVGFLHQKSLLDRVVYKNKRTRRLILIHDQLLTLFRRTGIRRCSERRTASA